MKKYSIIVTVLFVLLLIANAVIYAYFAKAETFGTATFLDGKPENDGTHHIVVAIKDDKDDDRPNEFVYYNRADDDSHEDVFGRCEKNSDNTVTLYNKDESVFAYIVHYGNEYKLLKDGEEVPLHKIDDTVIFINKEYTKWPYAHK